MDKLKETMEQIKNGWTNLERTKRIRLILIVSFLFVFVLGTTWWIQRTEYDVLFRELDPADAGHITENLETQKMKYKLEDGGSTILIDRNYIDKYRIELAVDGLLPENAMGFEIFDNTSMMATDEDRVIMYQRAIQGELERSISSLSSVESAKVMLSLPEDSIFQNPDLQKEASASVVLQTKGKNTLSADSVQGIASLISGAVENLPISNIRIIDKNGNLLSRALQDSGSAYASDVVTQRKAIEQDYEFQLEQKILNLLGPIYGLDKIQVSVFAELNFNADEMEAVTYNNKGEESVLSEQESVTGNAGLVAGVQGGTLEDNAGAVVQEGEDENTNSYDRTTNYDLDTYTEKSIIAPGSPKNLTASVVITGNKIETINEQNLIETVLGGIGTASIQYVPDVPEKVDLLTPNQEIGHTLLSALKQYWLYLVALGVLLMGVAFFVKKRKKASEFDEWDFFEDEEESEEVPIVKEPVGLEPTPLQAMKAADPAKEQQEVDEKAVKAYATENPEMASELIKIWLNEKKV